MDVRHGGMYWFHFKTDSLDEEAYHEACLQGEFREVRPPSKLVYTWRWHDLDRLPETAASEVTVELTDLGGSTEAKISHDRISEPEGRKRCERIWRKSLDKLGQFFG